MEITMTPKRVKLGYKWVNYDDLTDEDKKGCDWI